MHNHHPVIPYVSLCSGYEGIGLGLHRCIPNLRAVAYCEREAFAIANLVAKMENGFLDSAPVFTDVATFPWAELTEVMAGGVLSFGWPCQPVSTAGKRKATEDERWLFDIIADGIAIMRPGILFAENVEGLLSAKMPDGSSVFGHCIQRLESLHYRVAAGIFSASECGAPHQRKRVFIMAVTSGLGGAPGLSGSVKRDERQSGESDDGGHQAAWPSRPGEQQYAWEPPRVVGDQGRQLDDSGSNGHGKDNSISTRRESIINASSSAMADSHRIDRSAPAEGRQHDRQAGPAGEAVAGTGSIARGTSGRQLQSEQLEEGGRHSEATESGSGNNHGSAGEELGDTEGRDGLGSAQREAGYAAQSDEGAGGGQTQPPLGGDADGASSGLDYAELCVSCDNRTDELRLLGNGVVPATAERAFRVLIKELL